MRAARPRRTANVRWEVPPGPTIARVRDSYRTTDRWVLWSLFLGLLVLFGGLYAAGYYATAGRVPRGTTVDGTRLGGLTLATARQRLADDLGPRSRAPMPVTIDGRAETVDPTEAGLRLDVAATLARAGAGRSWDPRRMRTYLMGGDRLDPVVRVDRRRLDHAVDRLAATVDRPPRQAAIRFEDGTAVATYPEPGRALDRSAARALVREAYLGSGASVDLPTLSVPPEVSKDAVSRGMIGFANPAVSAPVVIRIAGRDAVIEPADFVPALSVRVHDGALRPHVDVAVLRRAIDPTVRAVLRAPTDATVRVVRGRPRVVPDQPGESYRPRAATRDFVALLRASDRGRVRRVGTVNEPARFTTRDAERLHITTLVGQVVTAVPSAAVDRAELRSDVAVLDGSVIRPGRTLSMARTTGRPASGGSLLDGPLGELATRTGLEELLGRSLDLRLRNTGPDGVLIQAWVSGGSSPARARLHLRLWSGS